MLSKINKLKAYMKRRGFSYTEFAEEIGVNPTTIFRYVRGDLEISGPVMYIIENDVHRCVCGEGVVK